MFPYTAYHVLCNMLSTRVHEEWRTLPKTGIYSSSPSADVHSSELKTQRVVYRSFIMTCEIYRQFLSDSYFKVQQIVFSKRGLGMSPFRRKHVCVCMQCFNAFMTQKPVYPDWRTRALTDNERSSPAWRRVCVTLRRRCWLDEPLTGDWTFVGRGEDQSLVFLCFHGYDYDIRDW